MINDEALEEQQREKPRLPNELQVQNPSLNIFLGSTPAHAALEAMRELIHLPKTDRDRVALVFLDIDSLPIEVETFLAKHRGVLRNFDLRISVAENILYADSLAEDRAAHTYIPSKIPESFDNGAGGIRNNGHVAACTEQTKVTQTIENAIEAITQIPKDYGAQAIREIQINLVSFLGGGTGSGILGDLAVMVRDLVLGRNLKHRLNIFCLLPEQLRDVAENDSSWRKSNATATLLELMALCLAKGKPDRDGGVGPYKKYMLDTPYVVRGTTVANEIFLFGRTNVGTAEDAARIIGLDLYTRMTNASSVGGLERSKAVDRRTLGNFDSAGLPTIIGTTCPLEVVFPAVETATVFAKKLAAEVLPWLAEADATVEGILTPAEQQEVVGWDQTLKPKDPDQFEDRQFQTAGWDRANALETRLEENVENAKQEIRDLYDQQYADELAKIKSKSGQPLGIRQQHLEARQRIYVRALRRLLDQRLPSTGKVDTKVKRDVVHPGILPGARDRAIAAAADEYNRVQRKNIRSHMFRARRKLLETLLQFVEEQLGEVRQGRATFINPAVLEQLRRDAHARPAWRGQIEHAHVHRRHIFDVPVIPGMVQRDDPENPCPPVQKLYEVLKTWSPRETSRTPRDRAVEFVAWMANRYEDQDNVLAAEAGDRIPLLEIYLREEVFLPALRGMNLFEIVEQSCIRQGERAEEKTEAILLSHLNHMRGLARSLVGFEAQLREGGEATLNTSLYLGISWRTGHQKRILDRARDRIASIGERGIAPMLASAIDPHRMQLIYGQHAISLGTIPDFFRESASFMSELLYHQRAWFGNGGSTYGENKTPVFSSGEMERLIMDPNALDGDRPPERRRSLPERVIRRPQGGAGSRPQWTQGGPAPDDGMGNDGRWQGDPRNPRDPRNQRTRGGGMGGFGGGGLPNQ